MPPIDLEPSLTHVSATQSESATPLAHEPSIIDYVDPSTTTDVIVLQTESPRPTPPPNPPLRRSTRSTKPLHIFWIMPATTLLTPPNILSPNTLVNHIYLLNI
jgi:hypothetical protein